jgi:MoxR-like ATPase
MRLTTSTEQGRHGGAPREKEDGVTSVDEAAQHRTGGQAAPDLDHLTRVAGRIRASIEKVIEGKPEVSRLALVVLLAEGHLLIEDIPGVGKTMLSKTLAKSIDCSVRRIQFTPDLLPSDVTGVSIFNQDSREFEFRPGGIFANIVVGDEINRASPKTQSALLECMEERQVTVDGATYQLESPFMVIATQNPIEMEGTYALPEAQRDRFMARVSMGYPVEAAEIAMLNSHTRSNPLDDLEPVTDAAEIRTLIDIVGQVYVAEAVQRYAVALTTATRKSPELMLGASPRATLHLVRAAKAAAAIGGRDYVIPDDVQELAVQVLAHRMLPTVEASMSGRSTEAALKQIVAAVPMPESRRSAG